MNEQRKQLYKDLEERTLNTPLEKYEGDLPNNNRLWIKNLTDSAFGSHYDLPYIKLFEHYEELGKIKPGDKIFESTSGSAGISAANIARALGYECHIAIPEGGEQARVEAIKNAGAHIHLTDANKYVNGFLDFNKRFLAKNRDVFFLNHSMGSAKELVNDVTLKAFENLAMESLRDIEQEKLDYFIPAIGNGSSVLGPGRIFQKNGVETIGFEPFQAGLAYNMLHQGKYEETYGIEPGTLPRSMLPGMSFSIKGKHLPIPHIEESIRSKVLEDVILVSDWHTDENYKALTGKELDSSIPRWNEEKYKDFGRSTRAGIAVAKQLSESIADKDLLVIAYDKMNRYDNQR